MRDDLHRTAPVTRPLRRVLRYASRPVDRAERLPRALEEAVRLEMRTQIRPSWLGSLRDQLTIAGDDLFHETRVSRVARQSLATAFTPLERELAERIRAVSVFGGAAKDNLLPEAMRDLAGRIKERSCEHLSSVVGRNDAKELRRVLEIAKNASRTSDLIDEAGNVTQVSRLPNGKIDLEEPLAE